MKKQSRLIIAAGVIALAASCNTAAPSNDGADEAFIDSAVNAKVEALRMEMMMQNDSIINVLAQERADSILNAMSKKTTVKRKAPARTVKTRDEGTMSAGGSSTKASSEPTTPPNTNTGKMGNQSSGTNTGKKGDQNSGTNTGKR
ncbi:MAG: hypothetical protein R2800_09285 [Flavipsychrobacter sp.]